MGTNYYYQPQNKTCHHCGHDPSQRIHIGKSSVGWYFSLHVYDEGYGPKNLDDWKSLWESGGLIQDEYGEQINSQTMTKIITERSCNIKEIAPFGYSSWESFHRQNTSEMGINGLLRHDMRLDTACLGHGESTYSMFNRDFS